MPWKLVAQSALAEVMRSAGVRGSSFARALGSPLKSKSAAKDAGSFAGVPGDVAGDVAGDFADGFAGGFTGDFAVDFAGGEEAVDFAGGEEAVDVAGGEEAVDVAGGVDAVDVADGVEAVDVAGGEDLGGGADLKLLLLGGCGLRVPFEAVSSSGPASFPGAATESPVLNASEASAGLELSKDCNLAAPVPKHA